jgi:hypothetical protein
VSCIPEDGDIIVRRDLQNGLPIFVLHTIARPDQLLVRTHEEAMAQAVAFAQREHVRVWMDNEGAYMLVEDFRTLAV